MRCGQAGWPRIRTGDLRSGPAGDLSLLETGAVSATIGLDCPVAAQAWCECAPGDRLSPRAVLCSRVGGSRGQGCLRLANLSEEVAAAFHRVTGEAKEHHGDTETRRKPREGKKQNQPQSPRPRSKMESSRNRKQKQHL